MSWLFNLVYIVGLAMLSPYLVYRAVRTGRYRRGWWEKLTGRETPRLRQAVWFHAVSVGEVLLLKRLVDRFTVQYPEFEIAISVGTATGYDVARTTFPQAAVFLAPLDFSWAVATVFHRINPALVVLSELELWPNLLLAAKRRSIPVAVVNVRMSERSHAGYRRFRPLLKPALDAVTFWGAQTEAYEIRLVDLIGVENARRVIVTGSMKYDGAASDPHNPKTMALRKLFGFATSDIVLVAGSTCEPEETVVLDAFESLASDFSNLRLVLVPRHKERFDEVTRLLKERGVNYVRRSEIRSERGHSASVTLVDSLGELAAVWGLADLAYSGGSLDGKRGGQSMIEPTGYGVPVCFGPHIWNFRDAVDRLLDCRGAVMLASADDLEPTLRSWLRDPLAAAQLAENGRVFVASQTGAVERTFASLQKLLPAAPAARLKSRASA